MPKRCCISAFFTKQWIKPTHFFPYRSKKSKKKEKEKEKKKTRKESSHTGSEQSEEEEEEEDPNAVLWVEKTCIDEHMVGPEAPLSQLEQDDKPLE